MKLMLSYLFPNTTNIDDPQYSRLPICLPRGPLF